MGWLFFAPTYLKPERKEFFRDKEGWSSSAERRQHVSFLMACFLLQVLLGGDWTFGLGSHMESLVCEQQKLALAILINKGLYEAFGRGLQECGYMTKLGMWKDSKTETHHKHRQHAGNTRQVSHEYPQDIWIAFLVTKSLRLRLLRQFYFSNCWVQLTFWCLSWPPEVETQDCLQDLAWVSFRVNGVRRDTKDRGGIPRITQISSPMTPLPNLGSKT